MRAFKATDIERLLRDCCIREDEDRRLHVDQRDGDLVLGVTWGEVGPTMGYKYRRIPLDQLRFEADGPGAIIEYLVREVRWLLAESRRGHGLVVGVAGKWRKFGRAA